ncbi:conserved hypothetical protein [gamma proteobacterium HdN1]|nr:conserved hypothetical protein [gamma proteobacterium HdN1]
MNPAPPDALQDIEIYAKTNSFEAIETWLTGHFGTLEPIRNTAKTRTFLASWQGQAVEIFLCLNAGKTGYASISFSATGIPWDNDIECARAAYQALATTIRCSESAWQEGDDPDRWYQISGAGEEVIHWPNPD